VGRLLAIMRKIVAYGTDLILILQQGAQQQGVPGHRCTMAVLAFGTRDLARIIARIKCGLQRAGMLEARLNRFVARGRDLAPPSLRPGTPRGQPAAPSAGAPPSAPRGTVLSDLPSVEDIAEQVRTRPLGTVIRDICRDIGLAPGVMDGVLWRELMEVAIECDIDLTGLMRSSLKPVFGVSEEYWDIAFSAWPRSPAVLAVATGPP
jgi:hypothetical protein